MFCPSCGAENADNTAFCAKCGTKIDPAAPNPPAAPDEEQPRAVIDFLPNVAEKIAMPVAFGSIAAGLVGTIAGFFDDVLSFVGEIPATTLELVLLISLYGGLRRIGSKASKWSGWLCGVSILSIAVVSLSSIFLIAPDQFSEKAAQNISKLCFGYIFWALLISVAFLLSVLKRHEGRLKTYAIIQLVCLLVGTVAEFILPDGLSSVIAFGVDSLAIILLAKVLSKDRPADLLKRIVSALGAELNKPVK